MKEEADKLIEQYYQSVNSIIKEEAIICAITSTENTIRVLEELMEIEFDDFYTSGVLQKQTEQKELYKVRYETERKSKGVSRYLPAI